MHATSGAAVSAFSPETPFLALPRSHRSPLTSLPHALSTATMASTSATEASSITAASLADCTADLWRRFLWRTSLVVVTSGFDTTCHSSIAAKSWRAHAHAWANAAIES